MATSNSTPNNQTLLIATTFLAFFLLLLSKVNSTNDITFNFNKFVPNQPNLIFQGAASVSSEGVLELTKVSQPPERSIGRALYAAPLQIYDLSSGKEGSFVTSFSFVVKAPNPDKTADGLTFFIAPVNSQIPPTSTAGLFGLFNSSEYFASNKIVAVEFDTFYASIYHPWDPDYKHIGIDVNSIHSIKTVKWDWRNGEIANVAIKYQASTGILTVALIYPSDETSVILSSYVDLRNVVTEWVSVGFSAGVGDPGAFETHEILSWYFTSNLNGDIPGVVMKNNVSVPIAHSAA